MKIQERVRYALANTHDEEIESFMRILRENSINLNKKANQSIFLSALFFAGWLLTSNSGISKISVFGAEISNIDLLSIILPPLSAIAFYRYQRFVQFTVYAEETLEVIYSTKFKGFRKLGLTTLLTPLLLWDVESSINNLEENRVFKRFGSIWLFLIGMGISFGPLVILGWSAYRILSERQINPSLSLFSFVIMIIVILTTFFGFIQLFKNVTE